MYWVCHWLFRLVCNAFLLAIKWTQSGKQRQNLLRDLRVDPFYVVVCFISSSVCFGGVTLTQNFVPSFRAQPFHLIELMSCSCPTELISSYLDKIMAPIVRSLPSYVKGSNYRMQGHFGPPVLHVSKSFQERSITQ